MTGVLVRRKFAHRYTHTHTHTHTHAHAQREDGHGEMGAEIGVMNLEAKECQGVPEPPETRREAQNRYIPRTSVAAWPC